MTRVLRPGDEGDTDALRAFDEIGTDAAAFLATPGCVAVVSFDTGDTGDGGGDGAPLGSLEGGVPAGLAYGHVLAHPDGDVTMLLYSLDVLEPYRRRGHGRAAVAAFVDEARRRGCSEVWVLTDDGNPAALATYASAGGRRDPTLQVMFDWPL